MTIYSYFYCGDDDIFYLFRMNFYGDDDILKFYLNEEDILSTLILMEKYTCHPFFLIHTCETDSQLYPVDVTLINKHYLFAKNCKICLDMNEIYYIVLLTCCFCYSTSVKHNVNILVLYSGEGNLAFISDTFTIAQHWSHYLKNKFLDDSSWKFNSTIECVNVKSDPVLTENYLRERLNNKNLPNVTAIIGPEARLLGNIAAELAAEFGIPCVLPITSASANIPTRPWIYRTAFLIEPPAMYQFRSLIELFTEKSVKSLVAVSRHEPFNAYNDETCFGAASLAATRAISVLKKISINYDDTEENIENIVETIRDDLRPDAIIWCDWASCALPDSITTYNPMKYFSKANYLPKALSLLDCVDHPGVTSLYNEGLFQYVSAGQFVSEKLRGSEYTEDATPYSSLFRPKTHANYSVTDQLNVGVIDEFPSSTKLFMEWYQSVTNSTASYQTVGTWGAFDILESAIYRACVELDNAGQGELVKSSNVLAMLYNSQAVTPFGRIIFDANNVNTPAASIVVQVLPSSTTAEIVAPSGVRTASFLYPMPTWEERIYKWHLISSNEEMIAVGIASLCTLLLLAISITVTIRRKESDVRMLNFRQILSMCLSGCIVCWSLALLWQDDVTQSQCRSYLWMTFVPASYLVNLNNVKAYRLSVLIRANFRKIKPFTHSKVLRLALIGTVFTILVLALTSLVDPPIRTLIQIDIYRPGLNQYHCISGTITLILLSLLVISHIVASLVSVVSVRNGMEAFKDGANMKDAFLFLYTCLLIVVILYQLNLSSPTLYLLRSGILSFGVTLFILRLLIDRCSRHWIPQWLRDILMSRIIVVLQPFIRSINPDFTVLQHSVSVSTFPKQPNHPSSSSIANGLSASSHPIKNYSTSQLGRLDSYTPLYQIDLPSDSRLNEMQSMLSDSHRLPLFRTLAKEENFETSLELLLNLIKYKKECELFRDYFSGTSSEKLRRIARGLLASVLNSSVKSYGAVSKKTRRKSLTLIGATAQDEDMAIPLALAAQVEKDLDHWSIENNELTSARTLLYNDFLKNSCIFDSMIKEISISLYQKLWVRFRVIETEYLVKDDDQSNPRMQNNDDNDIDILGIEVV